MLHFLLAAEHFQGDSRSSEDDFSVFLVTTSMITKNVFQHKSLFAFSQANSKLHSRRERRRNKAESIHDLRASSVSSKLKVPPSWTPPPTARSTLLRIPPLTPSPVAPTPTPATLSDAAPGNAIELTELTSGGRRRRKGGPRRPTDEVQDSQAALIRQSFAEGFSVHRHTCSAAVAARQQLEEYEVCMAIFLTFILVCFLTSLYTRFRLYGLFGFFRLYGLWKMFSLI